MHNGIVAFDVKDYVINNFKDEVVKNVKGYDRHDCSLLEVHNGIVAFDAKDCVINNFKDEVVKNVKDYDRHDCFVL